MSTIAVTGATGQLGRLVVAALLDRVGQLLADGTIKVPIQQTYELAQAPEALGALGSGHTQGKIAIRVA